MKAISYKMKNWISSFILPEEALETCNYPEHVLRLQKERQTWQKSKINLLFLWKTQKIQVFFKKKNWYMSEKIASKANNSVEKKNNALDWWDMPILRKRAKTNGKIKQQQQTLITSKNLCPF